MNIKNLLIGSIVNGIYIYSFYDKEETPSNQTIPHFPSIPRMFDENVE